jgi:hypothetical protein
VHAHCASQSVNVLQVHVGSFYATLVQFQSSPSSRPTAVLTLNPERLCLCGHLYVWVQCLHVCSDACNQAATTYGHKDGVKLGWVSNLQAKGGGETHRHTSQRVAAQHDTVHGAVHYATKLGYADKTCMIHTHKLDVLHNSVCPALLTAVSHDGSPGGCCYVWLPDWRPPHLSKDLITNGALPCDGVWVIIGRHKRQPITHRTVLHMMHNKAPGIHPVST